MFQLLLPSFFIFLFSFFSLLGLNPNLAKQQVLYFGIGLIIYFFVVRIGKKFFFENARFFYAVFTLLLFITFIIGLEVKGSKRWIDLYFFNFQSSEFLKIFFILFLSRLLTLDSFEEFGIRNFIILLMVFLIPTFLIFKQPDLGNAFVYVFIFIVVFLFSRIAKQYTIALFGLALLTIPFLFFILHDYQKNRIFSFLNPNLEQQGNAYNMIQAMITVGSGKLLGKGLGLGTQSRLLFLPEHSTDFAFSTLVEQMGFAGGFIVIFLYGVLLFMLLRRALEFLTVPTREGRMHFLYILGLFSYIFFQVCINIGMNIGLLPIAGIALPFISSGGSLLVTLLIGFALVP